jgi:pantoate--beta-alanine ligase
MGAFHEGHLALIRRAKKECDLVVVSLFVNPLQFGPAEDFNRYPRDLTRDRQMAAAAGADFLFAPSAKEIVPPTLATSVVVEQVTRRWEGAIRPGHFCGVATIVSKLFQIVRPDIAYLGQKDYQQTVVIETLVRDLHFDLTLRILPTVREKDGLAKSSRNQFLSPTERQAATVLYQALYRAKQSVQAGKLNCHFLQNEVESVLRREPRITIDYVALTHPKTLEPIDQIEKQAVLLIAVRIGSVRLIDNIILKKVRKSN